MIHYAVTVDGKVIGARSSAGHKVQIYTHAVIVERQRPLLEVPAAERAGVVSYHGTEALARQAARSWAHLVSQEDPGTIRVVPVAVTARRAELGSVVVAQGAL